MNGVRQASAAAMVLALVLGGCAATPPDSAPTRTGDSSATAPTPSGTAAPSSAPSPSRTPTDPLAGWQEVATPNGTATFRIPPGWTAEPGGEHVDYGGETHWLNEITLRDAARELHLGHVDGPYDDVGAVASFGVVRSTPVATLDEAERAARDDVEPRDLDHHAIAWWTSGDGAMHTAHAALANPPMGDSQPTSIVIDGERSVSFGVREEFTSEADAVAWLESDDVALLLEIVSTLDLTAIPAPALP